MSNISINKTVLDTTSLTVLGLQLPASVSYIILGSTGMIGNALLCYVIIRNENLRSNFYLKLFHIAVADSLFCLFSFMIGLSRLIHYATDMPETNSPGNCAYLLAPWFLFKNASPCQAVCVSLDRFLCVSFPVMFKNMAIKHSQLLNLALWVVCICSMSFASSLYSSASLVPTCTTGQIYTSEFNTISSALGITMDVVTIICYGGVLVVLLYRLEKGKRKGSDLKELKKSLQFQAVLTSFMLLGVYTFLSLSGEFHHLITAAFDPVTKSKLQPYSVTILLISCDMAFIICVMRNHDIKEAIHSLVHSHTMKLMRKSRLVSPLPNIHHSQITKF